MVRKLSQAFLCWLRTGATSHVTACFNSYRHGMIWCSHDMMSWYCSLLLKQCCLMPYLVMKLICTLLEICALLLRTTWQLQDVVSACRSWLASLNESAWSACFLWMLSVTQLHRFCSCASKLFNAAQLFPNGSGKNWALPSCCMVALMLSNLCRSHGRHQCYLAALWQSSIFFWTIPEKVSSVEKLRCTVVHCTQLVLFISAYDAQATMCKTLSPPTILYV